MRHCAFIRGKAVIGKNCVVGNSVEVKNAILFDNAQVPHFNYVGDSVLGYRAHMGAGAVTSNVKSDKSLVTVRTDDRIIATNLRKFGAMLGDYAEIGCNSVLCPGAVIGRGTTVYPTSCVRGFVPEHSVYKGTDRVVPKWEEPKKDELYVYLLGRLFGTDGVRGIANEKLNIELAMRLGSAAAAVISGNSRRRPVFVIGMDSRMSSDMLAMACAAGLCSVGADVIMLGLVPTPAVAYLVGKYKADAGIMISASHNPAEFNGIKMFSGEGIKLPDALEERIENYALGEIAPPPPAAPEAIGKVTYVGGQVVKDYVDHLVSTVSYSLEGLDIAVDCANGSASRTAGRLFEALGAQTHMLSDQPDGLNINCNCGSTHMEALKAYVRENHLDAGCGLRWRCRPLPDGGRKRQRSGRRHAHGHLRPGHEIARQAQQEHRGGHDHDQPRLYQVLRARGIRFIATKVGDRFVMKKSCWRSTALAASSPATSSSATLPPRAMAS